MDYGFSETSHVSLCLLRSVKWVPTGAVKFGYLWPYGNTSTKRSTEIAMSPAQISTAILVRTTGWPASPITGGSQLATLKIGVPASIASGILPLLVDSVLSPNLAVPSVAQVYEVAPQWTS